MSGHKRATVSISQDEYHKLFEAERNLLLTTAQIPEDEICLRQEIHSEAVQKNLHQIQNRQADYEELIQGLNNRIQSLEWETANHLTSQQEILIANLDHVGEELWSKADQIIDQRTQQLQSVVQDENDWVRSQLDLIMQQQQASSLRQNEIHKEIFTWLQDSSNLIEFIRCHYHHELLTPNELENFSSKLTSLENAVQNQQYDGLWLAAQSLTLDLTHYRRVLEKEETTWTSYQNLACEKLESFLRKMEAYRTIEAVGLDGIPSQQLLEVNDWTSGRYDSLFHEIEMKIKEISNHENFLPIESIKPVLESYLPECELQLYDLIHQARYESLNSQLRFQVAKTILKALAAQGFKPVNGSYEDRDFQKGYYALARDPNGCEVRISVEPNKVNFGSNQLHLVSSDSDQRTYHELRQRAKEIAKSLKQEGLEVRGHEEQGLHQLPISQDRLAHKVSEASSIYRTNHK